MSAYVAKGTLQMYGSWDGDINWVIQMGSKCEKRCPKREAEGDVTAKREPQQRSEDAILLALKEVAHRPKNARNANLTPEAGKKRFSEGLQRKHRTEMKNLNLAQETIFRLLISRL